VAGVSLLGGVPPGLGAPARAQPTTLVVTGYGGRWSGVMVKPLTEPFQTGHGVEVEIAPRRAWTEKWNRGLR
jgi:hypothetical protein